MMEKRELVEAFLYVKGHTKGDNTLSAESQKGVSDDVPLTTRRALLL